MRYVGSGYLNRYDSGLVIYWFGFDESIDNNPQLLVLSHFPDTDCEIMTYLNHDTEANSLS